MSSPYSDTSQLTERVLLPPAAKKRLIDIVGPKGYLDRPEDLVLYEYDGSVDKARPEMVVFPRTTEDVVSIVKPPDRGSADGKFLG